MLFLDGYSFLEKGKDRNYLNAQTKSKRKIETDTRNRFSLTETECVSRVIATPRYNYCRFHNRPFCKFLLLITRAHARRRVPRAFYLSESKKSHSTAIDFRSAPLLNHSFQKSNKKNQKLVQKIKILLKTSPNFTNFKFGLIFRSNFTIFF